ncbi:hypothetical protein OSH08_11790 [Kaistia geumhonensis]|uniref:Uncharacterized protein n=1 Tax=Kaistia geumhonensis TaxID=410839 RepID=A0ABU0M2C8_9HYPH|nr:hypothetical protein [Kaistia geumhonensis]MCX5479689.1 hypothetical protein [Kaistia geumhonensis]MDQ0515087.1 hypothetical protein [Kaistia geumhonensis]
MTLPTPDLEQRASRVATAGIIAGLVLTATGMMLRSPVAGAAGLIILSVLVLARRPIARMLARRSG